MTKTLEKERPSLKEVAEEEKASQLPKPCGYKILIALPEVEETTEGGIIKPDIVRELEEYSTVVGFVLKLGPDCYDQTADQSKKFPTGAYCKEGDFILFRAFQGTRIRIHGKEFRLINDDNVEAVVEDPRGIKRA
tara:strand:- start:878 stop:1282 length:405 start_codon:yes stop_codon:yes gene_type:complete